MRLRLLAGALVAGLVSVALPALAVGGGATAAVEFVGAGVIRGDLGPAASPDARIAAASALRRYAGQLRVDPADFRFESVRTSIIGTHVRGRQFRGGVPVAGTAVAVHVIQGKVWQVEARGLALAGTPAASPVASATALRAALTRLGLGAAPYTNVSRVLEARAGRLVDSYLVSVVSLRPARAGVVHVSAATGRVLAVSDSRQFIDGSAKVFNPNPIVTTRNPNLAQPAELGSPADADLDSPVLTAARRSMPLKQLDATTLLLQGRLQGPYVNVIAPGYHSTNGVFDITRGDPRFEGLMAYAHLDAIQRYYQALGFRGAKSVNAESQEIVATRVEGFDNSFYQPDNDLMLLGTGGVDDGEDAEVIVHEYGHATQDAQVDGWGATPEGGAMGEGFGDFLAAAYYARVSRGYYDTCVAEWDATSYATGEPPCLRRVDGKKRYPKDMEGEVHDDGEIWSAFLWRLRAKLGSTATQRSNNAIRLVLASHELLTPQAEFGDAVAALRTAARALGKSSWAGLIDQAAKVTNLPRNPA